jgi:hypothetical protein
MTTRPKRVRHHFDVSRHHENDDDDDDEEEYERWGGGGGGDDDWGLETRLRLEPQVCFFYLLFLYILTNTSYRFYLRVFDALTHRKLVQLRRRPPLPPHPPPRLVHRHLDVSKCHQNDDDEDGEGRRRRRR